MLNHSYSYGVSKGYDKLHVSSYIIIKIERKYFYFIFIFSLGQNYFNLQLLNSIEGELLKVKEIITILFSLPYFSLNMKY